MRGTTCTQRATAFQSFRRSFIPQDEFIGEQRTALQDAGVSIFTGRFQTASGKHTGRRCARRAGSAIPASIARSAELRRSSLQHNAEKKRNGGRRKKRRHGARQQQKPNDGRKNSTASSTASTTLSTSREERVADARRELTASFASIGQALPNTRQAFRDLVEEA